MDRITSPARREIVEDFAKEISKRKSRGPRPATAVIDFRNDKKNQRERDVYEVPIEILRFRKDNGRIASDVLSYEKLNGPLDERSAKDQEELAKFLERKDPEKTEELVNSLRARGQTDVAIITADGFLINGNRRKLALSRISQESVMRVVILPGNDGEGGPPTLREIEQIENRYQLQKDGKAEYYNFDRALSIRRKIDAGITLDEQLRDDPEYANLDSRAFEKAKKKFTDEYLGPLQCVDDYLSYWNRDGLYDTVSTGASDREGRWQAFIDYYKTVYLKLSDERKRLDMGIDENQVGDVVDVAFKLIRKRDVKDAPKVHMIMRKLPQLLKNPMSRKALLELEEIPRDLPKDIKQELVDADPRQVDRLWSKEFESEFAWKVNTAYGFLDKQIDEETPMTLLMAALAKLNHENLRLDSIETSKLGEAMKICRSIQERAQGIEHELFTMKKNLSNLGGRRS